MAVLFALLTALSNAVSVTTQHIASTADPRHSTGWRLVRYLFHNPMWLFGWIALGAAFVFQALALHDGLVSVVQPLLVSEIVFALLLRQFWIRQSVQPVTWGGAVLTSAGLAVFIVAGEPTGGHPTPTSEHWAGAIILCCAAAGVLAALAQRGSPGWRAGLFALAAGIIWALVAVFIKSTTETFTQFGVAGMFAHWPVYALAVGGASGTWLQQVALHVGPLRVSQPFLVIVDPVVSIGLSVWLFGERFKPDASVLAIAAAAFAVMCVGVVVLTQTAPATMEADVQPRGHGLAGDTAGQALPAARRVGPGHPPQPLGSSPACLADRKRRAVPGTGRTAGRSGLCHGPLASVPAAWSATRRCLPSARR